MGMGSLHEGPKTLRRNCPNDMPTVSILRMAISENGDYYKSHSPREATAAMAAQPYHFIFSQLAGATYHPLNQLLLSPFLFSLHAAQQPLNIFNRCVVRGY